jgi:putative Mn2+ efflux pump MntP
MALRIFLFVFPLALDTFALSIALGLRGFRPWKPALLFATFETVMPVFGIAIAQVLSRRFETAAVVIGGIILIGIGTHAIREGVRGKKGAENFSFGSLRSLLAAGFAISTDEIAAGFPLGASRLPIATVLLAIAGQTLVATAVGVAIGNRVRSATALGASRYASIGAGIVFTLLGAWLIAERVW